MQAVAESASGAGRTRPLRLTVLGGSSPGIPVLLSALEESQKHGRLGEVHVHLHGRNALRLERLRRFAELQMTPKLNVRVGTALDEALEGATHVLCMLRPGGMAGRARDEALALRAGTPADEGLGVGGLACFLRSRALMREVARHCGQIAPGALFLQMTSPLGLNVSIWREILGENVVGVCELPIVTRSAVIRQIAELGFGRIRCRCFGLNHQSWLYEFRDESGADVTCEVLERVDAQHLLGIDPDVVKRHGAIPMTYMRLYFHTARVLGALRQQGSGRGEQLADWSRRLDQAYCAGDAPDVDAIWRLLGERRMNWFRDGVVPVIEASMSAERCELPLNVPAGNAVSGIDPRAIVETDCEVSSSGIRAIPAPALPPLPQAITRRLLDFERAALGLSASPRAAELAEVLALHPLAPAREKLVSIATELATLAT